MFTYNCVLQFNSAAVEAGHWRAFYHQGSRCSGYVSPYGTLRVGDVAGEKQFRFRTGWEMMCVHLAALHGGDVSVFQTLCAVNCVTLKPVPR